VVLGYATYGVFLFAVLLLLGVLHSRAGEDRNLAAAGWACLATLVAVGINQPVGSISAEARPYTTHPQLLVWGPAAATSPSLATVPELLAIAEAAAPVRAPVTTLRYCSLGRWSQTLATSVFLLVRPVARPAGIEPATKCLEGTCSIR
jgi:hypothetical protein